MPRKPLYREEWCVRFTSQKATELPPEQAPSSAAQRGLFVEEESRRLPLTRVCLGEVERSAPASSFWSKLYSYLR